MEFPVLLDAKTGMTSQLYKFRLKLDERGEISAQFTVSPFVQSDKKKKGFLQRHLPSSADNEKESKNSSPLSSPQVEI